MLMVSFRVNRLSSQSLQVESVRAIVGNHAIETITIAAAPNRLTRHDNRFTLLDNRLTEQVID